MSDLDTAIEKVHRHMGTIHEIEKCASCEGFLEILVSLQKDIDGIQSSQAESMKADIQQWLEEGNQNRQQCLECEMCLPGNPYNGFCTDLSILIPWSL